MGKALKTAGVIIGAAALIATGVGAIAMPGLAGATTLFGVSTGTLNTISSGLVAVGGMLDKPKSQGSAQPDEWTSNPDQPIPFLFGRMGVAGKIVQRDEFGADNMYQGIVGIISGAGPIKGIQSFKGDDQAVTFDGTGKAITSQWQGEMWMVRRAGNQPDTVLTVPAGLKAGGSSFQWSASARLSGKACYLQILGENSKGTAYPGGIPDPVHVGEGIYGYDPRFDSTYPGGDGPCRLGVRSTYRYIEDPIIGGLNWALGLVENGQVVGGIGASPDGIDIPAFVEAANISEANGWKVAAWPDTSEDASSVLDQFLQAGGAVRARHAGKISCVSRGAPRASIVTITARDMAGAIELNAAPSLFDQLNTITPRFMSEAAGWKLTPANPVSFAEYVTEDGGKHSDQIDYRFVPLLKQAAELAAYDILDAREPFSGSAPLKPHMRLLKRGDCFVIDNPGVLLDGVKCIVLSRSYDPKTAEVRIGFRSETDGKHDLALGKTTTLPEFPVLTPPDPTHVSPPLPGDWVVTPRPPAPGGGQLPGFDLGGIVSNDTATAIIVEYGLSAAGPWKQAYQGPPTVTNIPIDGVQPGAQYWIAVQYQRDKNYSARSIYGPYTAPALIGDVMPDAPGLDQIKADIQEAFGDLLDLDLDLAAARLALEQADAALAGEIGGVEDRADALETLTTSLEANKASITQLNAQITRINNVEAVNATQATQIIDLGNNKVSLTEYNTLKAEVQNARDGATTLLGKIQQLKAVDLDLQTNKASVESVTNLTARTTQTESDILDLELAQASETSARASAVQQINARITASPIGTAVADATGSQFTGGTQNSLGTEDNAAAFATSAEQFVTSVNGELVVRTSPAIGSAQQTGMRQRFRMKPGRVYELRVDYQISGTTTSADGVLPRVRIMSEDGTSHVSGSFVSGTAVLGRGRKTLRQRFVRGATVAGAVTVPADAPVVRPLISGPLTNGSSSPTATGYLLSVYSMDWIDVTEEHDLSASVTEQSLAIIDLENQQALASWQVVAAAAGGKPARIGLTSSILGSFIALDAPFIFWGDNTVFDDATDTLQTTVGGNRRILALGAPFGADGTLLEWWGPSSVAIGSMTSANGYNGRMTVAPYVFDNALPSSGSGGAALNKAALSNSTNSSTFVTLGSLTFANRPASGWWEATFQSLQASNNSTGATLEFRVIESGAANALATAEFSVGGGGGAEIVSLNLTPLPVWAQTRPAGSITVLIQVRRLSGAGTTTVTGNATVTYTPSA